MKRSLHLDIKKINRKVTVVICKQSNGTLGMITVTPQICECRFLIKGFYRRVSLCILWVTKSGSIGDWNFPTHSPAPHHK